MTDNMIYVYFVSLGCAKNFVDTEIMAADLVKSGIGISGSPDNASVYCINTCAFIAPARNEAEQHIRNAVKWKSEKPGQRKIIVAGCLTQWDKNSEYEKLYPDIDLWLGTDMLQKLHEEISGLFTCAADVPKKIAHSKPAYLYDDATPRLQLTPHHYAYIKIADGCNNRCSYCSIPSIRGALRSRTDESVVREARNLIDNGVSELIIIAQDITAYGTENGQHEQLSSLVRKIDQIDGNHWIRLHYLHPKGISEELIDAIKSSRHVLPYLDIPLQHISDRVLAGMNRKVTRSKITDVLDKLRNAVPGLVIRTTFLVGFPGETKKDFDELCSFIKDFKFERLGVFPYYPEKGTASFSMKDAVSHEVALERAAIIQELHRENSINFNKKLVGRVFNVIVDSESRGKITGRTYMDSPEIDNVVTAFSRKRNIGEGQIIPIEITGAGDFSMSGRIVSKRGDILL